MFLTSKSSYLWRLLRLSSVLNPSPTSPGNLNQQGQQQHHSHTPAGRLLMLFCYCLLLMAFTIYCVSADFETASSPDTYVVFEELLYFEIVWPESLMYTFKLRHARDFGTRFDRVHRNVELIRADPEDACQDLRNDVNNAIALILRGGCSFLTKSKVAERAGAMAAIIADNDESNDVTMIDMIDDSTERVVRIPSYFLLGKDGLMIRRQLRIVNSDRAIINIPINLTNKPLTVSKRPPWTVW